MLPRSPNNQRDPACYSMMRAWDTQASVRAYPRRIFLDEEEEGKLYFSPSLVPVVQHPIVARLDPSLKREIIIQHLYNYLSFTSCFEIQMVNWGVERIFDGRTGFDVPEQVLFDAYKIYCDESYHTYFCADLKRQIIFATGVKPEPFDFQPFLLKLEAIQSRVPVDLRDTARLFVVILFETLISLILQRIPKDEQVVSAVRQTVADHADDEARHHVYFSCFLDMIWPQLTKEQQGMIGPLLPHFIIKSLEPDYEAIRQRLSRFDLTRDEIEQVIDESYPHSEVISRIRRTARVTLSIIERNGIYQDLRTLEAFQASGLLGVSLTP